MSVAANQQRTFLRLVVALRPHWRRDLALPARIHRLLAAERSFGSRDRRLYRELIYTTLRYLPWIEPHLDTDAAEAVRRIAWLAAPSRATDPFRAAFATGTAPTGDLAELLPAWFRPHAPNVFTPAELAAQLRRAPLWLRLQTADPAPVAADFSARGWHWTPSPLLPGAWQMLDEADVTQSESYRRGLVEVQDLGSQLLLAAAGIAPGERWLDACAGAGGKTLQLARLLGPAGRVSAHDIRPAALEELRLRAARAGLRTIAVLPRPAGDTYDGVLVDAPCSGSGTWRRSPHLKWATTAAQLAAAAATQRDLLHALAPRVRPGGRLLYATCSLSHLENEDVVASFLATHPEFAAEAPAHDFGAPAGAVGLTLLPAQHDTDGFYLACLRRA